MRITLIHNPTAGEGSSNADELMGWLADAGFDTRYQSTSEDDWESALKKRAEFIIAAGGDGTVTKVATALPPDALLAILPLGTANNLATSFGIHGATRRLIADLPKLKPRPFDLWRAAGPWGEETMIEGSGIGAITETGTALHLAADIPIDPLDKLTLARMVMKNLVTRLRPFELRAEADGKVIEGSFLAFEVMNVGLAGPQLSLCAKARSDDGQLDIAVVRTEERDEFAKWLADGARKNWRKTPLHRCRSLELTWHGERLRLTDGIVWPAEGEDPDPSQAKKTGKKSDKKSGKEKKKKKTKKAGKEETVTAKDRKSYEAHFSPAKHAIRVLGPE